MLTVIRTMREELCKRGPVPLSHSYVTETFRKMRDPKQNPDTVFQKASDFLSGSFGTMGPETLAVCLLADHEDELMQFYMTPPPIAVGGCAHFRDATKADEAYWKSQDSATLTALRDGCDMQMGDKVLVSVGTDEPFAHISVNGIGVLNGGGLLCILPGWTSEDGRKQHYARVNPKTGEVCIFSVETNRKTHKAEVVRGGICLQMPMDEIDEEEASTPPNKIPIDWIDAQRDEDFNLFFMYGTRNQYTGTTTNVMFLRVNEETAHFEACSED